MVELRSIYAIVYAGVAAFACVFAFISWRHRAARGSASISLTMLGIAIWSIACSGTWFATGMQEKILWWKAISLGVWLIPVGFLSLAFSIARLERWRTPGRLTMIAIVPLVLYNLEWWNPGRLFDEAFVVQMTGSFAHVVGVPGPLYWVAVTSSYSMVLAAFIIVFRVYLRTSGGQRAQAAILLTGAALPLVASAVTESRLVPLGGLDIAPLAFMATGALWLTAILRGTLLDILPLARSVVVEQMSDGVVVLDGSDLVVDTNPSARQLLHAEATQAIGGPADALLSPMAGAIAAVHDCVLGDVGEMRHEAVPVRHGRDSHYVELGVTTLGMDNRSPAHLLILHDVTEERLGKRLLEKTNRQLQRTVERVEALRDELREQAIRDSLTGLFNRRFLDESLTREMARAERQSVPVAFVLLDIDDFKSVNDTYSHQAGDAALNLVSEILLASARTTDIVCRYGGDEFAIVMLGMCAELARDRAESIRKKVEMARVQFGERELTVTVSIGVSSIPPNGVTAQDGMAAADAALYSVKQSGRNGVAVAA